jgi:polyisoprenoid-binding protein YceI
VLLSKIVGVAALIILLTACATHPRRGASPAAPATAASFTSLPAAGTYRIDPGQSELRVLVYRAGSLAHLGHNHVLVNRALSGEVIVGATLSASSISFSVPVDKFSVDDAQARREEGADFPGEVPDDAKVGTLRNMLSAPQLNAARFPALLVKSRAFDSSQGGPTATLELNVAGHDSSVTMPFSLQAESDRLTAYATFELRQTAVGLTPYSLLGGALQVKDALQVKIKILATAQ